MLVHWIEECVSTAHFSICLNGTSHGFFVGARGLRQGDPMSPYLFVLIMEVLQLILHQFIDQDGGFSYHWKCQDLGLFQLCFADDLLLFCKADESSIRLFKRGLHPFASLSGLHANPQKSQLILSKAAQPGREALLASLGFLEGHLMVRYTGRWLILPKGIIKEIEKRLLSFLWKGTASSGYPKVVWDQVCKPLAEGRQGLREFLPLIAHS
ncbi:UNVERIFIED_CONTAM: hypothetical protein Sradi_6280600 [Sesamum radiatum]|uniref:Reverse transcriptase domain-containing protein n=1 Tax=Sesamum radiatum TaxID=300843 RepID=A0AAW2KBD1_SESRA